MPCCMPYRYFLCLTASLGFGIAMMIRVSFVLVVTYITNTNSSVTNKDTIYPNCTVTHTSRDFVSSDSLKTSILFHAVYYLAVTISNLASGFVLSRIPSHKVFGFTIFLTCALCFLLPIALKTDASIVFAVRASQGLAEGMNHSSLIACVSAWALKKDKSLMLSLGFVGYNLFPGLAHILAGACICFVSWDSVLYIIGAVGVTWSFLWGWVAYPLPTDCPYLTSEERRQHLADGEKDGQRSFSVEKNIPWKSIVRSKAVWAIWIGSFCKCFVTATVVALQPEFFKDVFGMRTSDIGLLMALPFLVNTLFMAGCSYIADLLINFEVLSVTGVRKLIQCVGATVESLFFIGLIYSKSWQAAFAFLTLAYAMVGATFAGYSCNVVDLSRQYSGAVTAVSFSSVVGSFFSVLLGALIPGEHSVRENWDVLFWLEAALALFTALAYFGLASGERQPWSGDFEVVSAPLVKTETHKEDTHLLTPKDTSGMRNGKVK